MNLTRRDALGALAVLGLGSAAVGRGRESDSGTEHVRATMVAVADLLSPSAVTVDEEFVGTFVLGRAHVQPTYERRVTAAVAALDRTARREFGAPFASLSPTRRRSVFGAMGVDRAVSNPDGSPPQQVRYYLVHELLYALYSSPTGGRLLGMENPPGYPGGRRAYQRGPDE